MQITSICKTYSLKPTYGCNNIEILKKGPKLLFMINVVL